MNGAISRFGYTIGALVLCNYTAFSSLRLRRVALDEFPTCPKWVALVTLPSVDPNDFVSSDVLSSPNPASLKRWGYEVDSGDLLLDC